MNWLDILYDNNFKSTTEIGGRADSDPLCTGSSRQLSPVAGNVKHWGAKYVIYFVSGYN